MNMGAAGGSRLHDLEERFLALEPELPESAVKESLSLLHGMIGETLRLATVGTAGPAGSAVGSGVGADAAELWRTAPPMQGERKAPGLPVGTVAPDFTLRDGTGGEVRLADLRGRPVVVVFYPLDWSPGCSQQLDLYRQELAEFEARGAALVAISVDSVYSHGAWAAVRGIPFPLLSDFAPHGEVARRYGVWRDADGHSERAVFVIDAEGVIRASFVSPYLHHLPDFDELLAALDEVAVGEEVPAR
jgi:peroxiredoxin